MKTIAIILISLYQKIISPAFWHLGARCRFHPTCSEYAKEAYINLPWWRATLLTISRLLKCGPWHSGGVDLVPKKN